MRGENSAEVSLADTGHACRAGQCRLFRTDIDTFRVKAVRLQQPDELVAPAALRWTMGPAAGGGSRGWM